MDLEDIYRGIEECALPSVHQINPPSVQHAVSELFQSGVSKKLSGSRHETISGQVQQAHHIVHEGGQVAHCPKCPPQPIQG